MLTADSCKFLHDRSDYKHGWQLEREADQHSPSHGEEGLLPAFWTFDIVTELSFKISDSLCPVTRTVNVT